MAKYNNTEPLNTEIAFTSLTLLALLRTPMSLLIDSFAGVVGSVGAMMRIGDYLASDGDIEPLIEQADHTLLVEASMWRSRSSHFDINSNPSPVTWSSYWSVPSYTTLPYIRRNAVNAANFSTGWDEKKPFVLKDVDFSIKASALTFIIGPVGCGKSTLLHAILGETTRSKGIIQTSFPSAAICNQSPWLTNDTVRKNIVGRNHFDQSWYEEVIDACVLSDDLGNLPNGDQEMVGNNGVALSGGQQARVVSSPGL